MKQFDLKEYLKDPNKKVVTRDGRNVRIICTDQKGTAYSVIALCATNKDSEVCYSCLPNGRIHMGEDSCLDLFFAPEKHEGWANLYKDNDYYYLGSSFFISQKAKQKKLSGRIVVM